MNRVPLAWKNLTHDKRKLAVAIAGISFAVMLMFQQRGFNNALFDSTVALVKQLDADIIVFDRGRFSLSAETRFDREALDIAASCPGVTHADAVYTENSLAFLRRDGTKARPIRVIGYDLSRPLLLDDSGNVIDTSSIQANGTALMDVLSKKQYGFDLNPADGQVQTGELANRSIRIVGTFRLGRDFANDGNLIMSNQSLANYFPYRKLGDPLGVVDLGLIHCSDGTDLQETKRELKERLKGNQVIVLTRDEFIQREIGFWSTSTPIGVIFFIGAVMGFFVGVIICYQILANDISDHMSEFATLKAMGYGNWFFFQLVIAESLLLSVFGFFPGLVLSLVLFEVNSAFTGLIMMMTVPRALLIFALTVVMCVLSGLLALRKLLTTDPASLF